MHVYADRYSEKAKAEFDQRLELAVQEARCFLRGKAARGEDM